MNRVVATASQKRKFLYRIRVLLMGVVAVASMVTSSACRQPPTVKTVTVTRQRVEATVVGVSSGTVRSEQIAELAFGIVGRVRTLNVQLGDSVKAHQILAEVENEDLRSRVAVAREELQRRQKLVTDNAMSRSSLIQAQAEFDSALTTLEKSIIRAPCDGLVAELNLEVGQLSQITTVIPKALIRVVDTGPRYVRVEIDEVDLPRVRVGMAARVKILAVRREPFTGTVRKVVNYVTDVREQDRTSEIEISLASEGTTLPVGASADVEVVTESRDNGVALASRAILGRGAARYVFVVENSRIRKVDVTLGIFNYQMSEVVSGLAPGAVVALPSDDVELVEGVRVAVSDAQRT